MKLFFVSDIHGSAHFLTQALALFDREQADFLVLLGDVLYHGARNPLPEGYDPKAVTALLNARADRILAIRGNCDSEVDQMVLEFPLMSEHSSILLDGRRLFLTHGHVWGPDRMPALRPGDALFFGHIHIPIAELRDGVHIFNPGSITLPKEGHPNTVGVLEDGVFRVLTLAGEAYREYRMVE